MDIPGMIGTTLRKYGIRQWHDTELCQKNKTNCNSCSRYSECSINLIFQMAMAGFITKVNSSKSIEEFIITITNTAGILEGLLQAVKHKFSTQPTLEDLLKDKKESENSK